MYLTHDNSICVYLCTVSSGRTEKSGKWESSGKGQYLEGGLSAGAMLVDQRFLPRVIEGEIRCLMVAQRLVAIVHKKPRPGGYSATLQSGAVYTSYEPNDPLFAPLVQTLQTDLPKLRSMFQFSEDQAFPLLWTVDFMYGDKDSDGKNTVFHVGEFNCACVGITQQLHLADLVGQTAVDICFATAVYKTNNEEEVKE